jgi:prepilin-type N-terminal cleavage/methylation domain-containing protein
MIKLKRYNLGFTLIEVVIVLAIAASMMLMVFLAFNGAIIARQDQQRKRDASSYVAALEQYASNNGGIYPDSTISGFGAGQPGGGGLPISYFSLKGPTSTQVYYGVEYGYRTASCTSTDLNKPCLGTYYYVLSAKCNSPNYTDIIPADNSKYALVWSQTSGYFCLDNY